MKVKKYYDNIYMAKYIVVFDCTIDDFYKYINKEIGIAPDRADNIKPWNSLFEGMEVNGEIYVFIYLSSIGNNLRGLSHELAHAVIYIFDHRGIPINEEMDEAFCWYYDAILDTFVIKLHKNLLDNEK
jgi:hypothetical protein